MHHYGRLDFHFILGKLPTTAFLIFLKRSVLVGRKEFFLLPKQHPLTEKNGFVTVTKLGTTNKIFIAATKSFAAATKRFVDRTKHFVVVTKFFCYPYFKK